MGAIFDRTREHLVPADAAIVHMRRLLLTAARDLAAGTEPPRLPSVAGIKGVADTDLASGAKWQDLVPHHTPKRETSLVELND
jgi:phthalate 4,5-dioxygenase